MGDTPNGSDLERVRVLLLEDNPDDGELILRQLRRDGFAVESRRVEDEAGFVEGLAWRPDVVLSDYHLPHYDAPSAIRLANVHSPGTPVIVVSGAIGEDVAVAAMKAGAADYVLKDRLGRLGAAVTTALSTAALAAELRQRSSALHESEERFRRSFENAPVGIALVGLDGRWLQVNPALCELTGYAEEELLATTFQDITHPDDLAADLAHVEELIRDAIRSYQMEKRYVRKDGVVVWALLAVSLVRDEAGAPLYFVSQVQDISDRKRVEAAVAAAKEEADAANRAKSRFLSMVSHDVRTPMTVVVGYIDLLDEGMFGPLTEEQADAIGRIRSSAASMLELLDEVLDLSRIEAQRLELEPEPVDLLALVGAVRLEFAGRAERKGLALVAEVSPDLPAVVADPLRLRQILVNLVGNAIKFTDQGRIVISARASENEDVVISVEDSGDGISADEVPAIFDEFAQANASVVRRFGGSGLGLTIAKQLVEMHGGTLEVASIPGVGSTFTVRLPAVAVPLSNSVA